MVCRAPQLAPIKGKTLMTGFVSEQPKNMSEAERALHLFNKVHEKLPDRGIEITVGECTISVSTAENSERNAN
jgi:hypothetical protein